MKEKFLAGNFGLQEYFFYFDVFLSRSVAGGPPTPPLPPPPSDLRVIHLESAERVDPGQRI